MKKLILIVAAFALTGCLKTRSELGGMEQDNVYGQKAADNQMASQQGRTASAPDAVMPTSVPDEKDELIRGLNGRVEVLENQLLSLTQSREEDKKQYEQKLTLLQEAISKLENELHPPGDDKKADVKDDEPTKPLTGMESSDEIAQAQKPKDKKNDKNAKADKKSDKKLSPLEAGEEHFAKQDWKKAILSFNQYTDESPKGKHVPEAKYKIGLCFQKLGMREEAMAYFEEVAANYGSTDAGKKSKSLLAKLKK